MSLVVLAPVHLLPLIEVYCSAAAQNCPHVKERQGSFQPLKELQQMGLIEREGIKYIDGDDHGWRVTEKGRVYVDAILSTPLPVHCWTVPVRVE